MLNGSIGFLVWVQGWPLEFLLCCTLVGLAFGDSRVQGGSALGEGSAPGSWIALVG